MHHTFHEAGTPVFEFSAIDAQVRIGTNACCQTHFDERLLKEGVTGDISLEGEMLDHPDGVKAFLWLPTPDHKAPDEDAVLVGIAALKRMLATGGGVYIHCKNGHGRAPTFYAAYLVRELGLSAEKAVALVKAARPSIHLEPSQLAFIRSFEK